MGSYTQLTEHERYQIKALLSAGHNKKEIASILGRHKSTISREVKRNTGKRGYRPKQAHRLAGERQKNCINYRISKENWGLVKTLIKEDWSPEQISLWLKHQWGISISHESIYLYILRDKTRGGMLYKHLRCQKKRKKRYGTPDGRGQLKGRISIDKRPDIVNHRKRVGDWEADTVIGKRGSEVLVTLVERKSRLTVAVKVVNRTAEVVRDAIVQGLSPIKHLVKTITYDNGKEFALHQDIDRELNCQGYFAHPFHSWERGLNENTNGLIRQYFPKGFDLAKTTHSRVQQVIMKLNNRPRKCLDLKTPNQVLFDINPPVALTS